MSFSEWLGASTFSRDLFPLYVFIISTSLFLAFLVIGFGILFSIRYRASSSANRKNPPLNKTSLEVLVIVSAVVYSFILFFWGANIYFRYVSNPPMDAIQIFVLAKQWMWEFQHMEGRREANQLHVPVNKPVVLKMISQDVIHSFSVPEFRIKQDVLPDRYTTVWFEATKPGIYSVNCMEYCGTSHADMHGVINVLSINDFKKWNYEENQNEKRSDSLIYNNSSTDQKKYIYTLGSQEFKKFGCSDCHFKNSNIAPNLNQLLNKKVEFTDGTSLKADEAYIRDSIYNPNNKIVKGYKAVMPTFRGKINERQLYSILQYIISLSSGQ